jgi:hypothetical protein
VVFLSPLVDPTRRAISKMAARPSWAN